MIGATVNATRQELQKLKNRLKMARRGHKLLKDKRDELMKEFLGLIRRDKDLRETVERKLSSAYRAFLVSKAVLSEAILEESFMIPTRTVRVETGARSIMNVPVPEFRVSTEGNWMSYGLAGTSEDLDEAVAHYADVLPPMIELAGIERAVELLSEEIEKTRRRVNALEYVLIPELEESVKSIAMRLSEMERSNASRLMKIKDIVRAH
ncbi:MAG: V-type ATP synthase subunit D [Firmicutes bacterium]|jgi:V/A-type H+-transporting ATPase subunit D|nr:V-type ATP synthase subunit D [Bacillota bacterium]